MFWPYVAENNSNATTHIHTHRMCSKRMRPVLRYSGIWRTNSFSFILPAAAGGMFAPLRQAPQRLGETRKNHSCANNKWMFAHKVNYYYCRRRLEIIPAIFCCRKTFFDLMAISLSGRIFIHLTNWKQMYVCLQTCSSDIITRYLLIRDNGTRQRFTVITPRWNVRRLHAGRQTCAPSSGGRVTGL